MFWLKCLSIFLVFTIITFSLAGCGGALGEKEAVIAAFNGNTIDEDFQNDNNDNIVYTDAENPSQPGNGVSWRILHWNVTLTKHIRNVVIDGDQATVKATFTVSGNYQISVNSQTCPQTEVNFSSHEVIVQFAKKGDRWYLSYFPDLFFKSNPVAPSISNFKFTPESKEVSPGALISIAAEVHCEPIPKKSGHLGLNVVTRQLGIDQVTRESKLAGATDLSYHDSMFIQSDAVPENHYGGIYASELVNTGSIDHPDYQLYISAYIISIKITL